MAIENFEPPPVGAFVTQGPSLGDKGAPAAKPSDSYLRWWFQVAEALGKAMTVSDALSLISQHAAIGATPIGAGSVAGGIYRVSWGARITTPAGTSSSLTVKIQATQGGVALTFPFTAITGNTTDSAGTGEVEVRVDAGTLPKVLTEYLSVGIPAMQYALDASVVAVANPTQRTS